MRTNPIFYVLMGLAFLAAFVFPHASFPGAGHLQGIFAPVSRPVRAVAGFVDRHVHHSPVVDDRSPDEPRPEQTVYQENHELLTALASLQLKFDQLSQLNADRQAVGDIRSRCRPATVTGADPSGVRESLNITVGGPSTALDKRPVIRGNQSQSPMACDLIGQIVSSGVTGAKVRLITDPGFGLTARIGRYERDPQGKVTTVFVDQLHPLVQGLGGNQMAIRSTLSMQQVHDAKISVGDVVVLDDLDGWPRNIQGFAIGHISKITPQHNAPLFADIRIEPSTNLMRLNEVMVMVKD